MLMNYHIGRLVFSSLCVGGFVAADIWWCSFSSTIAMMHGPINIRLKHCFYLVSKYLVNEQNEDSYKVLLLHNIKKGERPTSYLQDTEVGSKKLEHLILKLFPVVLLGSSRK